MLANQQLTALQNRMDQNLFHNYKYWGGTRRFLPQALRVSLSSKKTGHWHGGTPVHRGARCFICKERLRLVWDINLADAMFPVSTQESFPKLKRLPLYYCFNCPQATTYQIKSDTTVFCMDPDGHDGGDETPYAGSVPIPEELPRQPICLTPLTSTIDALVAIESELGLDALDTAAQRQLSRFIGHKLNSSWDFVYSQFGGQPPMVQGHWEIKCPNHKCAGRNREHDRAFNMKELAVVEKDGITGISWVYAPLAFHICRVCGTIQGNFRCS
jgi:hypothetical protein